MLLVQSCPTLGTIACQAPLSKGFSRQEYWGGFLCPPPEESSQPRDWTRISCLLYWHAILDHWRLLGSPRVLEGIEISLKGSFSRVLYLSRVFHCIWCSWQLPSFYHYIFGNCLNPPLFIITVFYLLLLLYHYFYYWDYYFFFSPSPHKIPLFSFTNLILKIALLTISSHVIESLKHSLPLYGVASSRPFWFAYPDRWTQPPLWASLPLISCYHFIGTQQSEHSDRITPPLCLKSLNVSLKPSWWSPGRFARTRGLFPCVDPLFFSCPLRSQLVLSTTVTSVIFSFPEWDFALLPFVSGVTFGYVISIIFSLPGKLCPFSRLQLSPLAGCLA